jgi:nitric oxide reductase subunit B
MTAQTIVEKDSVFTVLKWVLLLTAIVCFAALGIGTYRTYQSAPPIPAQFVTPESQTLFTQEDIAAGKAGFQQADLMDYGSLYGMGSYYGEDYTAKYLVELGNNVEAQLAQSIFHTSINILTPDQKLITQHHMQQMLQHIDLTKPQLILPLPAANAVQQLQQEISQNLLSNNFSTGWTKAYSLTPETAKQVADFLIYSSLTTVAHRPDKNYSYTNNWPYEPSVGNTPTSDTFLWTWISFCFVFLGFGAVLYIYHHYLNGPDQAPKQVLFSAFKPLTASQKRTGKYFFIVSLVLLLQILVGSLMAHDYADRASFYGININALLPFAFLRDVHIQSPIIWIGLSWISSALFLAPVISGQEAKGQKYWVELLFWITLLIVGGAILGDYLGIMGVVKDRAWFWIGNQGLSYIELGRFWQLGFFIGLILWSVMVFRGLWPTMQQLAKATKEFWTGNIRLEHLLWASTINIAVLYWFGMIPLTGIEKSFTITDFWRWWVVHLWVEQSFEFFTVCISAYLLMALGLVSRQLAERTVLFETILIFVGGILGTGHHWYWIGTPDMWLSLGSVFSFIEVLPLMMLVIEAIEQHRLIKAQAQFPYRLAYLYVIGAACWNFVGAGVFGGGTLNAPLINYYEHATFLTLNHAHTALFGAFGLLALGLIYFCLRYAAGNDSRWSDRFGVWAFWLYNGGLILWILLNFFPVGWTQLMAVYEHGFNFARSNAFYNTTLLWQWLRFPGDVVFAAGALLMAWDFIIKLKPFFKKDNNE